MLNLAEMDMTLARHPDGGLREIQDSGRALQRLILFRM